MRVFKDKNPPEVQSELNLVEEKLGVVVEESKAFGLSEIVNHALKSSGKRIRPTITLLSGHLVTVGFTTTTDSLVKMATAVELLHIGTLIHDDIVDKSPLRRGMPTVSKVWGWDAAILAGDYILAKSVEMSSQTGNPRVVRLFGRTLMTICSGEIEEYFAPASTEGSYQSYLRRIGKKTASLISMAAESGAILSEASEETITALRNYGYNLGIAFQIVDDILDFVGEAEEMGKPVGSDLTQGILTLPAILFLEQNFDRKEPLGEIYEAIKESSVIQQSYDTAEKYSLEACEFLADLPGGASRQALFELAEYVIRRKK